ncbi:hypothetical protein ACJX0J_027742 [Zea mays]
MLIGLLLCYAIHPIWGVMEDDFSLQLNDQALNVIYEALDPNFAFHFLEMDYVRQILQKERGGEMLPKRIINGLRYEEETKRSYGYTLCHKEETVVIFIEVELMMILLYDNGSS